MFALCGTICYSVSRNTGLAVERSSTAWAWFQPKYFGKPFLFSHHWQGHVGFQLFSGYLGSTMHVGRPHRHFLFALQYLLEAELGSVFVCPVLSNNELRRAIGRCLFDAADIVMPLCGVSNRVCACACACVCVRERVYVCMWIKGEEKCVCFGTKITCQRRCFAAKTCQANLQRWVF